MNSHSSATAESLWILPQKQEEIKGQEFIKLESNYQTYENSDPVILQKITQSIDSDYVILPKNLQIGKKDSHTWWYADLSHAHNPKFQWTDIAWSRSRVYASWIGHNFTFLEPFDIHI